MLVGCSGRKLFGNIGKEAGFRSEKAIDSKEACSSNFKHEGYINREASG